MFTTTTTTNSTNKKYQAVFAAKWWCDQVRLILLANNNLEFTNDQENTFISNLTESIWVLWRAELAKHPANQQNLYVGYNDTSIQKALQATGIEVDTSKEHYNLFDFILPNGTVTYQIGTKVGNIFYSKSSTIHNALSLKLIDIHEAIKISENLTDHQATFIDAYPINNYISCSKEISIADAITLSDKHSIAKLKNLESYIINFIPTYISLEKALNLSLPQTENLKSMGIYNLIVTDLLDIDTAIQLTKEQAAILDKSENHNIIGHAEFLFKSKINIKFLLNSDADHLEKLTPPADNKLFSTTEKQKKSLESVKKNLIDLQAKLKEAGQPSLKATVALDCKL